MNTSTEWARLLLAGDEQSYERFVRAAWSQAVRTCWLILRNRQDAEEAAQDAFVSLYRHRSQVREPEKFPSWFYKILLNAARARKRRVKPHEGLGDEKVLAAAGNAFADADLRMTVQDALQKLSDEERITMVLSFYAGLTDREGAKAAGMPLGTYKWRLAKAKRRMSEWLREERTMYDLLDEGMVQNG